MTDQQMLELAAKAAGYKTIQYQDLKSNGLDVRYGIDEAIWNGENYWNPLEDDGDALRLAVRLGMEVWVDTHPDGCECTEAQSITYSTSKNSCRSIVNHDSDPYAATRRAIVRAAAEIGKEQA